MNVRARSLLDLAHSLHVCTNCDRYVEHGLNPCHENGIAAGKGQSIKSHDHRHFAGCNECHAWYDSGSVGLDPSGLYRPNRPDKESMFNRAFKRTLDQYWDHGWLTVA